MEDLQYNARYHDKEVEKGRIVSKRKILRKATCMKNHDGGKTQDDNGGSFVTNKKDSRHIVGYAPTTL